MLSYPTIGFTKLNPKAVAGMCSTKKVVPRNLAKFIGKHLCQSLFLIMFQSLGLLLVLLNSIAHAVLIRIDIILSKNI